ncbi:helix-turn-helix domain-containing protein [Limosilactobacillus sp.]|jgi:transcriptional regulator with XRE-family HTH domain|uniref:helix-turn-helix domain-containing protein n=1 Tax=Limosilactobacillus sp. TaxID=2773925 RepID=UPI00359FC943
MDIQRFVHRRRQLGYSQVSLSRGICTQSTLSKFENKGKVPSLAILEQLCGRLGLTIDDLSQDAPLHSIRQMLAKVERYLMMEQFPQAIHCLRKITSAKLQIPQDQMQYYYLRGMIETLTNAQSSTALFNFTKILDELDERHQTIYSQLAYLGAGILYARQSAIKHAGFFFNKVIAYLQKNAQTDWVHVNHQLYLRIIMMTYYTAEFHALNHRLTSSNQVLTRARAMCAAQHVTYFMPRIELLLAENAIEAGKGMEQVGPILTAAMVFARFNCNNVVAVQTAAVKRQFESEIAKVKKN